MISLLLWIVFVVQLTEASAASCQDLKESYEKTCMDSGNYNYLTCMRTRMKRHQADCEFSESCFECDCESCSYSICGNGCDNCCHSCCSNFLRCHNTHCCHKQCHTECRTYDCRNSCRRSCYNTLPPSSNPIHPIETSRTTKQETNNNNTNAHNVTTIIILKNFLNNTNHLNVPINLNLTNRNNISALLKTAANGGALNMDNNCCVVIGPRQCVPTPNQPPYTRCFHTRSRQCGSFCTDTIVHKENNEVCNSVDNFGQPTNCKQQTAYIPQPQPRCTYTSTWPYVSCGIQPPVSCEGCKMDEIDSCSPMCYQNFNVGPFQPQSPWGGFGAVPQYNPFGGMYPGMSFPLPILSAAGTETNPVKREVVEENVFSSEPLKGGRGVKIEVAVRPPTKFKNTPEESEKKLI